MPELAEVEYYRRVWDAGKGGRILRVHLHPEKRVFRGTDVDLIQSLKATTLRSSEASGKQMLFRFSKDFWLGIHLGMTGRLSVATADYTPARHDHLVLYQPKRALVFTDARQFGRVLAARGKEIPAWWAAIGPAVTSKEFTPRRMEDFLRGHDRLPIKAALLLQKGFPGIGNWMADEILWRAGISPRRLVKKVAPSAMGSLWKETRYVARRAMEIVGKDFSDPPPGWLFHERWSPRGLCPKHGAKLKRATVGGRTTAWCAKCQK